MHVTGPGVIHFVIIRFDSDSFDCSICYKGLLVMVQFTFSTAEIFARHDKIRILSLHPNRNGEHCR